MSPTPNDPRPAPGRGLARGRALGLALGAACALGAAAPPARAQTASRLHLPLLLSAAGPAAGPTGMPLVHPPATATAPAAPTDAPTARPPDPTTTPTAAATGASTAPVPSATPGAGAGPACPDELFLEVAPHPANARYPDPRLTVRCAQGAVIVESNGIPTFPFRQITPNDLAAQDHAWRFPLEPVAASAPVSIPLLGPAGVAFDGLPIFGPNEAARDDYGDPYLDGLLDACNGHTAMRGDYHYHARNDCLLADVDGAIGRVVGFAFDGYPILAPTVCVDAHCTSVRRLTSSWRRTADLRNAWAAHTFVAGSGDLDRCNGLASADGSYRYFATDTFPYFMACYHGTPTANGPAAGGGGARPPRPPEGAAAWWRAWDHPAVGDALARLAGALGHATR